MHPADFDGFTAVMGQLASVYGKKLDDVTVQGYWRALKDRPLSSVSSLADKHMRYGKFFPKPFELRPKDEKPAADAKGIHEGDIRAEKRLEEFRRRDPEGWLAMMERERPHCRALQFARQHGVVNIYFNLEKQHWDLLE